MGGETSVKNEARRLVEKLPEDATWDDVFYQLYVHQATEAGLQDCDAGRTLPVSEVRRRLGLSH